MNNLSWFLYFAEVVPRFQSVLVVIAILIGAGWFFRGLVSGELDYPFQGLVEGTTKPAYRVLVLAFVLMAVAQFIPSKQTIYLIAGSEAGESVAASKQGQKVLNDIQEIINYQLSRLKESEE